MNDRELLELAAKAAGVSLYYMPLGGAQFESDRGVFSTNLHRFWSPLTDDGDALRLGMTLAADGKLRIQVVGDDVTAFQHWDGVWVPITWTFDGANPSEAFRHAIVRAAAEIGRNMP